MKLDSLYRGNKPPSLEEGPLKSEKTDDPSGINTCLNGEKWNSFVLFVKVVFYVELILLIGWIGCLFITNHYANTRLSIAYKSYNHAKGAQDHEGNVGMVANIPRSSQEYAKIGSVETSEITVTESMTIAESDRNEIKMSVPILGEGTERSILLSQWLDTLERSENEDDQGKENPWTVIWSKTFDSDEGKSEVSSSDSQNLSVDWDAAMMQKQLDPFYAERSFESSSFPDSDGISDLMDRKIDWDSVFQNDEFTNLTFDFQLTDLFAPHLWQIQMGSSMEDQDPHSSMISGEETSDTQMRMVKRSLDSSSSESSDSSVSDNDNDETPGAGRQATNCPKILDDEGNAIEDPKSVVDHIKKNWFNWLLETPVPDCHEPQTTKTVTVDECGKFVIKCTLPEGADGKTEAENNEDSGEVNEAITQTRNPSNITKAPNETS